MVTALAVAVPKVLTMSLFSRVRNIACSVRDERGRVRAGFVEREEAANMLVSTACLANIELPCSSMMDIRFT